MVGKYFIMHELVAHAILFYFIFNNYDCHMNFIILVHVFDILDLKLSISSMNMYQLLK